MADDATSSYHLDSSQAHSLAVCSCSSSLGKIISFSISGEHSPSSSSRGRQLSKNQAVEYFLTSSAPCSSCSRCVTKVTVVKRLSVFREQALPATKQSFACFSDLISGCLLHGSQVQASEVASQQQEVLLDVLSCSVLPLAQVPCSCALGERSWGCGSSSATHGTGKNPL